MASLLQKVRAWFLSIVCTSSWITTQSSTGKGAKINRQLKFRLPPFPHEPQRFLASAILTEPTSTPFRRAYEMNLRSHLCQGIAKSLHRPEPRNEKLPQPICAAS
jgi:hypothetical protein